jgi:hypothetical protein
MSSLVAHSVTQLNTSIAVDETILSDDPRIIVMRFGSKSDTMCKFQDEVIMRVAPRLQASSVVVHCALFVQLSCILHLGKGRFLLG